MLCLNKRMPNSANELFIIDFYQIYKVLKLHKLE